VEEAASRCQKSSTDVAATDFQSYERKREGTQVSDICGT
jgi:hypothetical protein